MILLYILLALLVLLLAAGYAGFRIACVRKCVPPVPPTPEYVRHTSYARWAEEVCAGADWFLRQDPQELHVMSYDGKRLAARFLPCENAKGTVLLFHGYRSSGLVDFGLSVQFIHRQGYNILLPDQRAHGASEGRYITFGARERYDVLSWVTYLSQMLGQQHPMYLIGISMGASTVLMSSCFDFPANVRGIVADCGFTSPYAIMRDVLHERCPQLPAGLLLFFSGLYTAVFAGFTLKGCSTVDAVRASALPVLFLHGTADRFVPLRMSEEACNACMGEKRLLLISGANHAVCYAVDQPRVQSALEEFFENHLPKEDSV